MELDEEGAVLLKVGLSSRVRKADILGDGPADLHAVLVTLLERSVEVCRRHIATLYLHIVALSHCEERVHCIDVGSRRSLVERKVLFGVSSMSSVGQASFPK